MKGVPKISRRPWTDDEVDYICDLLMAGLSGRALERKSGRSEDAIRTRFNELGIHITSLRRADAGCRTMLEIARLMGVTHQMVYDWIIAGELPQVGRVDRKGRPPRYVTDEGLMQFLAHRPAWPDWSPDRIVDADWRAYAQELRDTAGGRWLTTADLGKRYHVSADTVTGWVRRRALSVMDRKRRYYIWSADLEGWQPPYNTVDATQINHRAWATRRQRRHLS